MIPTKPPPKLSKPENYSTNFNDFIEQCLQKDSQKRPSCYKLLEHSFVKNTKSIFVLEDLLEEMYLSIKKAGSKKAAKRAHVLSLLDVNVRVSGGSTDSFEKSSGSNENSFGNSLKNGLIFYFFILIFFIYFLFIFSN